MIYFWHCVPLSGCTRLSSVKWPPFVDLRAFYCYLAFSVSLAVRTGQFRPALRLLCELYAPRAPGPGCARFACTALRAPCGLHVEEAQGSLPRGTVRTGCASLPGV